MVDGWRLRKSWYWPQPHNDVVQKLLRKARKGTKVILRPRQSRRMAARLLRTPGRRRDTGARGDPRHRRRAAAPHHSRRRVRRRRALCALARAAWATGPTTSRIQAQSPLQPRAAAPGLSLLVAFGLSQIQGQERRPVHRRLRRRDRRRGARGARSTASSAATSTTPRSARSAACSIATTAIGSRAARRWSSISTAGSRSCTGWSCARSTRWTRAGARDRAGRGDFEDPARHRRLAAAGERRRAHADSSSRASSSCSGHTRDADPSRPVPHHPLPGLSRDPPGARRALAHRRDDRGGARPTRSTSSPRGRSGFAARRWCLQARLALHHRLPHALSRISGRAPYRAGRASPTRCCGAFTRRRTASWWRRRRSPRELAARGFANLRPWTRGVDRALFDPALRDEDIGFPRPIFLSVGRDRAGEEPAGVPGARPAGLQGRGRRGAGARRAEAPLSRRAFPRPARERQARAALRLGRRVRLSEPHRHVRPRHARGAGLGPAGRGLSGAGAARRDRRRAAPACSTRICARPRSPRSTSRASAAARTRSPSPGPPAPASSSSNSARSARALAQQRDRAGRDGGDERGARRRDRRRSARASPARPVTRTSRAGSTCTSPRLSMRPAASAAA